MTYRRSIRYQEQIKRRIRARHEGRLRAMMEREPAPIYELPELRARITYECFDTGEPVVTVFTLHRTPRIDSYFVAVDGVMRPGRKGMSKVLEFIRKAKPRKCSLRWTGGCG